jgi:trimethylamine--corrinoid protein Co-methyltransferase
MDDGAVERGTRARRRGDRGVRVVRDITGRRQLRNPFGGATILSDDHVAHLHAQALLFLQSSGVKVLLPEARTRFAAAGAAVDDDTHIVRLDASLAQSLLDLAPAEFTITARNTDRSLIIGGDHLVLAPVAGPPYVSDRVHGRRPGTLADFDDFVRLTQRTEVLHTTTPAVEAQDVPMQLRHLHTTHSTLTLSDKVPYFYARGRGVVADSLEMIRLANGVSDDEFCARPYAWTNINTNSPRQLDVPMCMGIIDSATAGQATIMTPFTLAGAMAPVTLAGALLLQHVEAVAAIALAQIVRPGAPVIYGAFTSNVDMKSGAPAFGTPEGFTASIASGQLARHIGVPWRSQATSTSNTEDAQGAAETMVSLTGALLGGANVVLHAAGWQEGGLVASLEKFVLDVEVLDIVAESLRPIPMDDASLAVASIDEVGPGGHFFGTSHTLDRFESAFHEPVAFTRQNHGQWTEGGSVDAATRATEVWQRWLTEFEPPPTDADARAALDEFVQRRVVEGGALPES